MNEQQAKPAVRWAFYAVGALMAVYGVTQLFGALSTHNLVGWGAWVVGGAVLHDLVIAPVVAVVGFAIGKTVPARARSYVSAALIISGMVVAVALPFVLRLGYDATVPSALPLNYAAGLGIVLAVVWVGVGLVAAVIETRRGVNSDQESVRG